MKTLYDIRENIQQIVETLRASVDVEVMVIGSDFVTISETAKEYNIAIERILPKCLLIGNVMKSGQPCLRIISKTSDPCEHCRVYSSCDDFFHMSYPFSFNNKTLGVISFVAFNENQKSSLLSGSSKYSNLLKLSAKLIEDTINIKNTESEIALNKNLTMQILDNVYQAIIVLDAQNNICYINSRAIDMLDITSDAVGKNIASYIQNVNLSDTNKEYSSDWYVGASIKKVVYKVRDIYFDNNKSGQLITFDYDLDMSVHSTDFDKGRANFLCFSGDSNAMVRTLEKAELAAHSESTIMILGESGTKKVTLAFWIHTNSLRKNGPFIPINCANIPNDDLEKELFGYEKGALKEEYSMCKPGKFELANNGTLFLGEFGALALDLQEKLLHAIKQREVTRVGATRPINVNVRLICSTHMNIGSLVSTQLFLRDLYYNLNIMPIKTPALRDRADDVLIIAKQTLAKLCKENGIKKKTLSKNLEDIFLNYNWPGNISELENILEYSVNFSTAACLQIEDLPDTFIEDYHSFLQRSKPSKDDAYDPHITAESNLDDMSHLNEYKIIMKYIEKYGQSTTAKREISKKLGISMTTLYRRLNYFK